MTSALASAFDALLPDGSPCHGEFDPLQKLLMLTLLEFRDSEIAAPAVSDCCP
jgi:hypothetical protein